MKTVDERIAEFDALPKLIKCQRIGMADDHMREIERQRELLKIVERKKRRFELEGIIGPVAVLKCCNKDYAAHPYTAIYRNNNEHSEWKATHCFWPTPEMAMLDAIGHKHDGINTRFATYAGAMIGLVNSR